MRTQTKHQRIRGLAMFAGAAVVLALFLTSISGCASNNIADTAHQVHSMTPCGMMMDAMMGNAHGSMQGSAAAPGEGIPPPGEDQTGVEHAH